VFLEDVFTDNTALADAINKLLVVGFYLLNVGFVLLGLIHFTNVYVFNSIRRRVRMENLRTPPLPPQQFVGPAQPAYPR
jgi:hypothetical protein